MIGEWESRTECIIATDTVMPNTIKAWKLSNYGFDMKIKKFLWFKWYTLLSTDTKTTYSFPKDWIKVENVSNTGTIGEVIGKLKFQELVLCIDNGCKCDKFKSLGKFVTYEVIRYKRYDGVDHMIWSPTDSTLSYNERYLQSIFWYRE